MPTAPASLASIAPVLRACDVSRRYAGVQALEGVSVEIRAGEVLAVVGENGAGKSTLMKIIGGIVAPSSGHLEEIGEDGAARVMRLRGAAEAARAGIALVHQEVNLAEDLDLTGVVLLGGEIHKMGWLDRAAMDARARDALLRVGLEMDPRTVCGSLPIAARQLVEIARALATNARVLVLDEPTSSLSSHETERLLATLGELRRDGVAIVFVSHRLDEVMRIADRVIVLRDGKLRGELQRGAWSRAEIERLMVGRELPARQGSDAAAAGTVRLEVRGIVSRHKRKRSVSLSVRRGEVVALAGLVGAGRSELLAAIAGSGRHEGTVLLDGREVPQGCPARVRRGIAMLPEDRARDGLLYEESVARNISLAWIGVRSKLGLVRRRAEAAMVADVIARTQLRPAQPARIVRTLSGGNQQKAILGRLLGISPSVLLLDEPTRGVDVGARAEIHEAIRAAAGGGAAVLVASSEMEEVLLLAHRIVVLHDGAIVGELSAAEASEEAILRMATGGANQPAEVA